MKKNVLIGFLLVLVLLQFGYTSSRSFHNPGLMSMHRREFIAAGIAQGLAANGQASGFSPISPEIFADKVLQYTDALTRALDRDE